MLYILFLTIPTLWMLSMYRNIKNTYICICKLTYNYIHISIKYIHKDNNDAMNKINFVSVHQRHGTILHTFFSASKADIHTYVYA